MVVGAALENFPLENPKNSFWFHVHNQNWASGPSPILLNAIFIEINPHGKEFTMNKPRAHGVGNTVAWGHHLLVPLRCQNRKLSTPSREKPPTEHTTINTTMN
jgi:hypothetical protein